MNQLAIVENLKPAEIYLPENVDSILKKITEEAKLFQPDISTVHGRKELASFAYKIAQSKTFMDDCGKKLGEEAKKTLDTINAERKKIRETLDLLKEEVRKPLTDWELKEEKRKSVHRAALVSIENESQEIARNWQLVDNVYIDGFLQGLQTEIDWKEFKEDADTVLKAAEERVLIAKSRKKEHDDQQDELKKLREEKEQREKEEADRIEKERAEARVLAEAEAKKKAEEFAKKEEAEREQKRIAREKQLAAEKEAAIKYEREQIEIKLKQAADKAARDKQAAIDNERKKIADEKAAADAAEQKRQANIKHRTKINNEILKCLKEQGLDEETGKKIITAIVSGMIPHTKINY
jgi:hypothetical protein